MTKVSVTILQTAQVLKIDADEVLLPQLLAQGINIKSSCGAQGVCADCVVRIAEGSDHCSFLTAQEKLKLGNVTHLTQERLSCQLKIYADVVLDLSTQERVKKKKKPVISVVQKLTKLKKMTQASKHHKSFSEESNRNNRSELNNQTFKDQQSSNDTFDWKKGGLKSPKRRS